MAGLQPSNRSVTNELAGRTKHSPGTVLSSIVGAQKTLGFGKEQMSFEFAYLPSDVRTPGSPRPECLSDYRTPANNKRLKENSTLAAFPFSFSALQDWLAGLGQENFYIYSPINRGARLGSFKRAETILESWD